MTRRCFLKQVSSPLSLAALSSLLSLDQPTIGAENRTFKSGLHFAPKAKRVIYLFQSGGPSQMDLYDYKPRMNAYFDEDLPDSVRNGQRFTTMTSGQNRFPIAPSMFKFSQHGQSGTWLSELLPHTSKIVDDICIVRSMNTQAINHDPAVTFFQTGSQQPGRPSIGAWASYGLGSENENLPAFIVMLSRGSGRPNCQPLYDRLWGSGFLPSQHQGCKFLSNSDPVAYLSDPPGIDRSLRRAMIDDLTALNKHKYEDYLDPEIATRIEQYELAFRMQSAVPELIDLSTESKETIKAYGPQSQIRGSFASNCLLARRLVERGVRFVQLYHMGWDQHGSLPKQIRGQCLDTDQASAALIQDLKRTGLLQDTLVVWGGEFGRTIYSQGKLTHDNYGRDHHPRCFSLWMAGGGIKPGLVYGETDDHSYNIIADPVHVHDLQATLLHLLGVNHRKLTFRFQGRDFRLTDVHGEIVHDILL
jgi:Protein of unknown function (DUF1501)